MVRRVLSAGERGTTPSEPVPIASATGRRSGKGGCPGDALSQWEPDHAKIALRKNQRHRRRRDAGSRLGRLFVSSGKALWSPR
jgi:hypothetical protein